MLSPRISIKDHQMLLPIVDVIASKQGFDHIKEYSCVASNWDMAQYYERLQFNNEADGTLNDTILERNFLYNEKNSVMPFAFKAKLNFRRLEFFIVSISAEAFISLEDLKEILLQFSETYRKRKAS